MVNMKTGVLMKNTSKLHLFSPDDGGESYYCEPNNIFMFLEKSSTQTIHQHCSYIMFDIEAQRKVKLNFFSDNEFKHYLQNV